MDIREAIDDLKRFAKVDLDRYYLSGHSSGGDNTSGLVQRTPDLWVAAGTLAGNPTGAPADLELVPNLCSVPFSFAWEIATRFPIDGPILGDSVEC
jgi:poly(3-hydroxybutyrate) depolymerase